MNKFFNDILTGKDNNTYDIGRVGIAAGIIMLFLLEIIKVSIKHDFSEIEFCSALSGILAIGSGALRLKSPTEPEKEE